MKRVLSVKEKTTFRTMESLKAAYRRGFSRGLALGLIPLAVFIVLTGSLLHGEGSGDALFIDEKGALKVQELEVKGATTLKNNLTVNGNVGIGTNDPKAKLEVNGDIRGSTVRGASWSHTEKIEFQKNPDIEKNLGIIVTSRKWDEIEFYTRKVKTPALSSLHVTLNIPFVGNHEAYRRNRILLVFDDENICDATNVGWDNPWDLNQITLNGLIQNVREGEHIIKVFAAVDGGRLYIPHYNPRLNEHTLEPSIFANLYLIGFY